MTPEAIAWDIDGTLIDSEPLHQKALQRVCAGYGVDIGDLPDDAFCGVHVFDVWDRLRRRFPQNVERDAWLAAIDAAYVKHAAHLAAMPNATAVVAAIHGMGVPQVCVSNSSRVIVDANIRVLGIGKFLEFSISLDDVGKGKPDAEPYLSACRRLGADPSRVIAVEDSATGAASAYAAGLTVIGLAPSGAPFAGVTATIADPGDILALLPAILRRSQ